MRYALRVWSIPGVSGRVMARSRCEVRGNLSSGRWLLRRILVLLVSATFAYALNDAITGRAVPDGRLEVTVAPGIADLPCMLSMVIRSSPVAAARSRRP